MPRVSPSLTRRALNISPYAATLLPACRDIPSALTELRWIREHVQLNPSAIPPRLRLPWLCRQRGNGVPLQYVLGSQPFGHLDIKCRPGVLIPRPEPEAYSTHLAHLIKTGYFASLLEGCRTQGLKIVDFCSGTGCIALLLYNLLQSSFPALNVRGIDISHQAINLSRENIRRNIARGHMPGPWDPGQSIRFDLGDIFNPDWQERLFAVSSDLDAARCDVLISNPPYISASGFARDTARSVRNYEPKLAQVPVPRERDRGQGELEEDVFYSRMLEMGEALRPKIMLFEVGGAAQARRVAGMVRGHGYLDGWVTEIWRDWPDAIPEEDECRSVAVNGVDVATKGSGHERSVLIYKVL